MKIVKIFLPVILSLILVDSVFAKKQEWKMKVAVIEFEVQGNIEIQDAGKIMAEWMITSIGKKEKFVMVERVLLKKILEEDKLIMSGVVDEGSAQEIGQKYGVDAIITGAVSKWGDIYTVTVRLIDTYTGEGLKFAEKKTRNGNKIAFEIDKLAGQLVRVKVKPHQKQDQDEIIVDDNQIKTQSKEDKKESHSTESKKEEKQTTKQEKSTKKSGKSRYDAAGDNRDSSRILKFGTTQDKEKSTQKKTDKKSKKSKRFEAKSGDNEERDSSR